MTYFAQLHNCSPNQNHHHFHGHVHRHRPQMEGPILKQDCIDPSLPLHPQPHHGFSLGSLDHNSSVPIIIQNKIRT